MHLVMIITYLNKKGPELNYKYRKGYKYYTSKYMI